MQRIFLYGDNNSYKLTLVRFLRAILKLSAAHHNDQTTSIKPVYSSNGMSV